MENKLGIANIDILPNRSIKNIIPLLILSCNTSNQLKINNNTGKVIMNFMKFRNGKSPFVRKFTNSLFDSVLIKIFVSCRK